VSMKILVINPNTSQSMTDAIAVECRRSAREGTVIDVKSPARGPRSIESYTEDALASAATLELALEHRNDYDAFVVACFDDPAIRALREMLDVPVFGIAESAAHMAALVSSKFSVVTVMRRSKIRLEESIERSGLMARCASVRAVDMSVLGIEADLDTTAELIAAEARRAMEEDDAEAICLGCAGLGPLDKRLQKSLGIPVLDGCACAIKLAEACYEYGITTSKYLSFSPPPQKEYVDWSPFDQAYGGSQ
jgi:allantoin racemase